MFVCKEFIIFAQLVFVLRSKILCCFNFERVSKWTARCSLWTIRMRHSSFKMNGLDKTIDKKIAINVNLAKFEFHIQGEGFPHSTPNSLNIGFYCRSFRTPCILKDKIICISYVNYWTGYRHST